MRIDGLIPGARRVRVVREAGDKKVYNESRFFYLIRNLIKLMGYDIIKTRMSKDGHMVCETQPYIRSRRPRKLTKDSTRFTFYLYFGNYQIRNAYEDFNKKGEVILSCDWNVFSAPVNA